MEVTRRSFLSALLIGGPLAVSSETRAQGRDLPRPDPALFQSGDFVWPKKPGAYVPYNAGSGNTPEQDKEQWIRERDEYVRKLSSKPVLDASERDRLQVLRGMDYREFIAIYAGAQKPGIPGAYSGGSVYVGHVGIIEVDANKTPWVIEAVLHPGVQRMTYADWITGRPDQVVWLGRLRQLEATQRAKVSEEARRYLGRPYDFWNFDLSDDSGFYCSKLAWLSIYRALKFPVDGIENTKRGLWFSPKDFLNTPTIMKLHDPGPYAIASVGDATSIGNT